MTNGVLYQSRYMPCRDCGGSVDRLEAEAHACEHERRVNYEFFLLRGDVAQFDAAFAEYLASPRGCFEQWYAARTRRD